jgi:hypothetical protein
MRGVQERRLWSSENDPPSARETDENIYSCDGQVKAFHENICQLKEVPTWMRAFVSGEIIVPVRNGCVALSKIMPVSQKTAAENAGRIRQGSSTKL